MDDAVKIKDFIAENENQPIEIARENEDPHDPMSDIVYEGMLQDIPGDLHELEVTSTAWLIGAKKHRLYISR